MKKIIFGIVKIENEYRALMKIGENPYLPNREIVYQRNREIKNNRIDVREIIRELKEEAKEWAREHKIKYIVNIDISPYEGLIEKRSKNL